MLAVAGLALAVPASTASYDATLIAFVVFEATIGMYWSVLRAVLGQTQTQTGRLAAR